MKKYFILKIFILTLLIGPFLSVKADDNISFSDTNILESGIGSLSIDFKANANNYIQPGIKYWLKISSDTPSKNTILYNNVSDEEIILVPENPIDKKIDYKIPLLLPGKYSVDFGLENRLGFSFGQISLGEIVLKNDISTSTPPYNIPTAKLLDLSGCSVTRGNSKVEKNKLAYFIPSGEQISLSCYLKNPSKEELAFYFLPKTTEKGVTGKILGSEVSVGPTVYTIKAGEEKLLKIEPFFSKDGKYLIEFSAKGLNMEKISNIETFNVVYGSPDSFLKNIYIDNISGDLSNYSGSLTANFILENTDKYYKNKENEQNKLVIFADMLDFEGNICSQTDAKAIDPVAGESIVSLDFKDISSCQNPKIKITVGNDNETFDEEIFELSEKIESPENATKSVIYLALYFIIIIPILVYLIYLYRKTK